MLLSLVQTKLLNFVLMRGVVLYQVVGFQVQVHRILTHLTVQPKA